MTKYPIEVFWSDEDEGYIATLPDLPGCSAWGATEAEAIAQAHDASAAWIKAAKAAGRTIPEPTPPLDEANYSGRFLMRVPRHLHAELARHAKRQGVSLNQYVLYLLASGQGTNATAAGKTKRAA
jgi:predicted RNase H-like HicB family nuclease